MEKNEFDRRKFVLLSTMGIGGLALSAAAEAAPDSKEILSSENADIRRLKVLCIGAHPGDPEFGCGGTLAKYSDAGHQVTLLYLTRGEAGDPTKSFAESAELRTKEAETSCAILKATAKFAGQIDGNTELNKSRNEVMTHMILSEKPDIVFTQWPIDSHMDHQVAGLLTLTAWIKSGRQFHLYFYEVNTGSETMGFEPTDYVDITEVRDRKKAAMFAHKTQNPQEVYDGYFRAMEDFRGLEVSKKAAEGFIHFKPNAEKSEIFGLNT
jgi:LmbE family N-acetylglucosaminyl deacetylase